MASAVSYDLQGQGGGKVLIPGDSSVYNVPIRWIQVINECVLSECASSSGNIQNAGYLSGIILPAGTGIGGLFSSVDVQSGVVIVYFA